MNRAHEIIDELRAEIEKTTPTELPAIRGQLAALEAEIFVRLVTPATAAVDAEVEDEGLTCDETAAMLGQTSSWVRAHKHELPRVPLPGRTLRFSKKQITKLLAKRRHG